MFRMSQYCLKHKDLIAKSQIDDNIVINVLNIFYFSTPVIKVELRKLLLALLILCSCHIKVTHNSYSNNENVLKQEKIYIYIYEM